VRLGVAQDTGASLRETGSRASTEPASSLRPLGFDPARGASPCQHKWRIGGSHLLSINGDDEFRDFVECRKCGAFR
jgi:hypothetical protein